MNIEISKMFSSLLKDPIGEIKNDLFFSRAHMLYFHIVKILNRFDRTAFEIQKSWFYEKMGLSILNHSAMLPCFFFCVCFWRIRVSIPVPRRCERRALPIEPIPHHITALCGIRTHASEESTTWTYRLRPLGQECVFLYTQSFLVRDLNPGRQGENLIS